MTILTNTPRFPTEWAAKNGTRGRAMHANTLGGFLRHARACDVVLIECNPRLLMMLAAAFTFLPFLKRPLVTVDIVLRKPVTIRQRLAWLPQRWLLSRVDHFMHYFTDLSGYQRYFGVGPERSSFVPFKPNLRYRCEEGPQPDGEYVLCFGHSMRDFDSFFDAVATLPYPAAIARPDMEQLRRHGSRFTRRPQDLPEQVRLIDHDPRDYASQVKILRGAKMVVVPLLKTCLNMAGTPLNAMLLGKCVLLTEGPATNGLFTDEVLPIPAEDAKGLAAAIDRAWRDDALRERTAAAGYRYAMALGGEPELRQRVIDRVAEWVAAARGPRASGPMV